jgi:murein DD-endopeptidase MepM/ murein hydrolase activator NlpD
MSDPISAASVFVPQTPTGDETKRRLSGKSPEAVAKEFESILLAQVISAMRKTVPESGVLEASASRRMLDGAFDQEVARSLAAKGGLGIAEQIVGQIQREQARRDATAGMGHRGTAGASPTVTTTASAASARAVAPARTAGLAASPAHAVVAPAQRTSASAAVTPVEGEISSPFGMRSDPFTGEERFHAGVDVAAPRGTAIRAVADGEVVFSGWRRGGEGRVVEVRHADGLVTSYAHAEKTLVRAGQHVVAGEVVATVGSSGRASGPHLHFGVARDGQAIDPAGILERSRPGTTVLASIQGPT